MNILLLIIALLLSFFSLGIYWIISLVPIIGIHWLQYTLLKRLIIHSVAITIALLVYLSSESLFSLLCFIVVLLWTALTFVLVPGNIFPALMYSVHKKAESGSIDSTEVLGLNISDKYIAYPILDMVAPHHIINDKINNTPYIVTYCPACRSGMVYSSVINETQLTFAVAGLYRKNMTFIDNETKTIWQQATGKAIYGQLKGHELSYIFFSQLNLNEWIKEHPDTYIATEPIDSKHSIIPKTIFNKVLITGVISHVSLPGLNKKDIRLNQHEVIAGIKIKNFKKAYPLTLLKQYPNIFDKIGEVEISISYNSNKNEIIATNTLTKEKIFVERHWWLAWSEFYPDTLVYNLKNMV